MIIVPPAYPTGYPHLGHAIYLIKVDTLYRTNFLPYFDNSKLVIGYDCHGLPTKCKIGQYNLNVDKTKLAARFTVEGIKEFEKLINLLNILPHTSWTTSDLFFQKFVDEYIEIVKSKNLLYHKKDIQQYCIHCKEYLSQSELGTLRIVKKNYKLYFTIDDIVHFVTTTKPEFIQSLVAIVYPSTKLQYKGKIANIKFLDINLPIIIDDENYDKSKGEGYMVGFCGSRSDFEFITKHNLSFENYIDPNNETYFNMPFEKKIETDSKLIEYYMVNKVIEQIDDTQGAVIIHSERTSCQKTIEYHYSLQYYIDIQILRPEIYKMIERIEITPLKYKINLIKWVNNARDWCISRKYSWGSHMHTYIDQSENVCFLNLSNLHHYNNIYYDTWLDSSLTWWYTQNLLKSKSLPLMQIQGYEIMRTWAYYSIISAVILGVDYPFKTLKLTNLLLDANGKKYSKSSKNYLPPKDLISQYGIEAFRLWAVSLDSDSDQIVDVGSLNYAKKSIIKLKNIIKFSNNFSVSVMNNLQGHDNIYKVYYNNVYKKVEQYKRILQKTYNHKCNDLVSSLYVISTQYIQKNYEYRNSENFKYYLANIVKLYVSVFEPIIGNNLKP